MANITIRNFKVYNESIYPAIMFEINYKDTSLIDKDFILNLIGCVYSDDEKFLSNIIQLPNIDQRLNQSTGNCSGEAYLFATPIARIRYTKPTNQI